MFWGSELLLRHLVDADALLALLLELSEDLRTIEVFDALGEGALLEVDGVELAAERADAAAEALVRVDPARAAAEAAARAEPR